MTDSVETALVCGIVFVASLVRSTFGFGDALVAMPLLAFVLPMQSAAPLVAFVTMSNAVAILLRDWRHISLWSSGLLTVFALMGIPVGAWLLTAGDERLVKGLLGIVVLAFSIWSLLRHHSVVLESDRTAPLFGVLAGILAGAYNTAGPPLVVFGTLRRWPPEQFRANLQGYFLIGGSLVLIMHAIHGRVTYDVGVRFGFCVPLIVAAGVIARHITQRISAVRFVRLIYMLLVMVGLLLVMTALRDTSN